MFSFKHFLFFLFCFCIGNAYAEFQKYDTVTKADYVFSCMIPKGGTPIALRQCACSIDVIETLLPLSTYVEAETYLRMRLTQGERAGLFRETERSKEAVASLRKAQVISEEKCFPLPRIRKK